MVISFCLLLHVGRLRFQLGAKLRGVRARCKFGLAGGLGVVVDSGTGSVRA